jgi:hypothetical protein
MRKVALVAAAIVAAVIFFLLATLPPQPARTNVALSPELARRTVGGAYHIHSTRSDGAADKDAIAAAASRAGLAFIILTDHGDGMRTPDPPAYLHGVLCVDAVEISTSGGHYVAVDMQPAPYPLGGEPSAVVEDVKRLGGFGIVAHPDSPKSELAWKEWDAPFDGIEWLSADSEWRDESRARLGQVLFDYLVRPAPALASLLDRPVATFRHWDDLLSHRRVVGLAGVDAHGGIGRGMEEGGKRRPALGTIPSYEASFRTFTTRAILDRPFSGDAPSDAKELMAAIRSGRVFTLIDALASPGFLGAESDGPRQAHVDYAIGDGGELFMVRAGHDSLPLQAGAAGRYELPATDITGVVRFEVRLPKAPGTPPIPWIVGNPLYFSSPSTGPPASVPENVTVPLGTDTSWHVEKDPETQARVAASGAEVKLEYTLAADTRRSQFAAAVTDFQGHAPVFTAVRFSVAGSRPGRVSVQLRYAAGGGERWGKSVYFEGESRAVSVPVAGMVPADLQKGNAPDTSTARSLLFVVDLTNARPGDSNAITVSDLRLVK